VALGEPWLLHDAMTSAPRRISAAVFTETDLIPQNISTCRHASPEASLPIESTGM
jgi:hypothetical protein